MAGLGKERNSCKGAKNLQGLTKLRLLGWVNPPPPHLECRRRAHAALEFNFSQSISASISDFPPCLMTDLPYKVQPEKTQQHNFETEARLRELQQPAVRGSQGAGFTQPSACFLFPICRTNWIAMGRGHFLTVRLSGFRQSVVRIVGKREIHETKGQDKVA